MKRKKVVKFLCVVSILCVSMLNLSNEQNINFDELAKNDLVRVKSIIPDIELDIKYATEDNFMKTRIYAKAECYLLNHVANALKHVQEELKQKGYRLKIFDGYRPISAQKKMWQTFPDSKYVSDPYVECGRHTRGTSVDVTLVKLDGSAVVMPSEFDCFEKIAHSDFKELPNEVIKNREFLKEIMFKHGFTGIKCEWWHFDYKDWKKYPPLDIQFTDL
jgi:zinc D-Ala-D-Ala dipeptidase